MTIDFQVVGIDAGPGHGTLVADADRVLLVTDYHFSYTTGRSPARVLKGRINGNPVTLVGSFWVSASGTGLLVSELRIGSDELQPTYTVVRASRRVGCFLPV
ncbi:hypothetical protein [Microbacterium sp. Gd 4-13]|uniref:hypothetical protein n=1 Tax=Microbacterium sp. Gd 4-13 TaxID=2173179 RepID=UPI001057B6E0|nr:hypothetical protein [Microbacterium sp. Gd 4-13]